MALRYLNAVNLKSSSANITLSYKVFNLRRSQPTWSCNLIEHVRYKNVHNHKSMYDYFTDNNYIDYTTFLLSLPFIFLFSLFL